MRTEDFSARFLEEMLEPTKLSAAGSGKPISGSENWDKFMLTEQTVNFRGV